VTLTSVGPYLAVGVVVLYLVAGGAWAWHHAKGEEDEKVGCLGFLLGVIFFPAMLVAMVVAGVLGLVGALSVVGAAAVLKRLSAAHFRQVEGWLAEVGAARRAHGVTRP